MTTSNRLRTIAAVVIIFAALGLGLTPTGARAQIKEFVIGIGADPDTCDSVAQSCGLHINMMMNVWEPLFFLNPDNTQRPNLAMSAEVSPDGLKYVVHLRKGVTFHDGTDFNASALKWNIDRILDPEQRVPIRSWVRMLKACTVLDEDTIQLELKYPYPPFKKALWLFLFAPVSPTAAKKTDPAKHPYGTGPYKFVEHIPGERLVMVRNENYWGKKPAIEKIIWKIIPEPATREAMLMSGEMDLVYKPSPPSVAQLEANPDITVATLPTWRNVYMAMNCQKGVLKNKKIRQAFNYAVDAKTICKKVLFDMAAPVEGPMSPDFFGYAKGEPQFDYNPDKAKQLLKEANFDFSQTIHMATCHGRLLMDKQVSEAIQAYLQAIGVKVELRVYDWPTHVSRFRKPLDKTEHMITLIGWGPHIPDADLVFNGVFTIATHPPKGLGVAFYSSPQFEELVKQSTAEADKDKREALLKQASKILWSDAPWIWLHREKIVMAYRSKYKGLALLPVEMFFTHDITLK